jgi:hypothetical protein
MKEVTPGRGPRRPPLFNFDGKEVVAAVEKEQVEDLDPVLQEVVAKIKLRSWILCCRG